MANETTSTLNAYLETHFAKKVHSATSRHGTVLSLLRKSVSNDKNLTWLVNEDGTTFGSRAEGADWTDGEFTTDAKLLPTLAWSEYGGGTQVSDLAQKVSRATPAVANEVLLQVERKLNKVVEVLETDVISGDGTDGSSNPNIVGLLTAIDSSGSYGGVTDSLWQSTELANGGTPRALTAALMESAWSSVAQASEPGSGITAWLTSYEIFNTYKSLFRETQMTMTGGAFDASPGNLTFQGAPIIPCKSMSGTGAMLGVDLNDIELVFVPSDNFISSGLVIPGMDMMANSEKENVGLPVKVEYLPRSGTSHKVAFSLHVQLKVGNRANHCKILDLAS